MQYTIQKGDTLGTIAAKFLGTSQRYMELAKLNPQIKDINKIEVGQVLTVPDAAQISTLPAVIPSPTQIPPQNLSPAGSSPMNIQAMFQNLLSSKKLLIGIAVGLGLLAYLKSRKTRQA